MSEMTVVTLVLVGVALIIAASWQLAGRAPFDAIQFVARIVASFVLAAVMVALFYGLVFVIGLSNIGGINAHMGMVLHTSLWMSIGIAFVMAISPGDDRRPVVLRFIARWVLAWVRVASVGILLTLGFCTVMSSI
jgi:hypothetical protein